MIAAGTAKVIALGTAKVIAAMVLLTCTDVQAEEEDWSGLAWSPPRPPWVREEACMAARRLEMDHLQELVRLHRMGT